MEDAIDRLGLGLYTSEEAAHLLGIPRARVRRWLGGYVAAGIAHPPLWVPQLPKLDGQLGLGFLDLMQLRIVQQLVLQTRISLQQLRRALQLAEDLLRHDHPFATASFRTDGRRLFLEIGREAGEPELYDIFGKQFGFHRIIEPSFRDVDLQAAIIRWWPLGKHRSVVLDPQRSFGAPVIARSGIATATLADAAEADGSIDSVTRWFPVSTREVRDAIAFERRLSTSPPARRMAA